MNILNGLNSDQLLAIDESNIHVFERGLANDQGQMHITYSSDEVDGQKSGQSSIPNVNVGAKRALQLSLCNKYMNK